MNVIFCVAFFVGLLGNSGAELTKESVQTIDHPHKNEYASSIAGTDKHKYGYELKQNRHFHHTTTEEDGVRLGCYGYELEGKKYSTQYVADVKGYRPVYTHDLIDVYPKSGDKRQASFVGDFNEDEQRSGNIRYFFPDGCKGIDVEMKSDVVPMPGFIKKSNDALTIPKKPAQPKQLHPPPLTPLLVPPFDPTEAPATTTTPVVRVTPPPTAPPTTKTPLPTPALLTRIPVPQNSILRMMTQVAPKEHSCSNSCCADDEASAKLILPVPMKGSSDGCQSFAKLIIPVNGLNPDSLRSLTKGSDTTELIKSVLQALA